MLKVSLEVNGASLENILLRAKEETLPGFNKALKDTTDNIVRNTKNNIKSNSYKTGILHNSIISTVSNTEATIKATAKHAPFIEFGTRAHTITPKSKSVLAFEGSNGTVFTKKVNHPGIQKKPFLEPAFNEEIPEFLKRLEKVIDEFD